MDIVKPTYFQQTPMGVLLVLFNAENMGTNIWSFLSQVL